MAFDLATAKPAGGGFDLSSAKPVEESGGLMQGLGNLAAGAVRGAGSIGATLLYPVDKALDFVDSGGFGDKVSNKSLTGLISGKPRVRQKPSW